MIRFDGEKLLRENAELRATVTELTKRLAEQFDQIAKLTDRVDELLAVAKRRQRKPPPEKTPPPPPSISAKERLAFDKRPKPPEKKPRPKPPKSG